MAMPAFPNVLLDLDGTLTDPGPGFLRSIEYALEQVGVKVPPESDLVKFIGPPLEESLRSLVESGEKVAAALGFYRARYNATGLYENSMYDGVVEALESISASGSRIFLATSKPEVIAQRILQHFELSGFFAGIYGSQFDGTHANKKSLLSYLLDKESILVADAVMVGDRLHDMEAACANGIHCLGVLWGYGSEVELRTAGASGLVTSPRDLPGAIGI